MPTNSYPIVSAPLAVWNLEEFEVEADFLAEHLEQINAQTRAALVLMLGGRHVA